MPMPFKGDLHDVTMVTMITMRSAGIFLGCVQQEDPASTMKVDLSCSIHRCPVGS
jgi:hypothetical protein